ncbi:MFS transporter [Stappia sp. GBMRC 2046]|uniref:MFS transporter n=1 Tax=Stappia sediminis TaxID=2692190 RepID=A0A7X3S5R8_9HYPH|nr:MFS transporter [Stappia sediminis]MXN63434.1 MFS transporter [Stappia sediminis]
MSFSDTRHSTLRRRYAGIFFDLTGQARWLASLTLILGVGSHAVNGFVTAAALPDIIRELGGQERAFWVFTLFQVAAIVAGTMTGTLKARLGAKPLFIFATLLLLAGSLVAGLALSIPGLLAGRFVQGFGEGMIMALCYIVIPDLFEERAVPAVYSLLSAVWALAAGAGPLMAGILIETWSWRAAFLANVPLTALLLMLALAVIPSATREKAEISDKAKAAAIPRLLMIAIAVTLISFIGEMSDPKAIVTVLAAGLGLIVFTLYLDGRSALPFVPKGAFRLAGILGLSVWIRLIMSSSNAIRGVYYTGIGQSLWGLSVTQASYASTLTAFSWTIAAWLVAGVSDPDAQRRFIRLGTISSAIGLATVAWALFMQSFPLFAVGSIACGAGFGMSYLFLSKSIIYATEGAERDRAAGIIPTLTSAGVAIGAAITSLFALQFGLSEPGTGELVTREAAIASGPPVFLVMAGFAALAIPLAFALPKLRRAG